MQRKNLIYIPLFLILMIQFLDKEDHYLYVQYMLLGVMIILLVFLLKKKRI